MQRVRSCRLTDLRAVFDVERAVFGEHVYPDFFFRQALDLWGDTFLVTEGDDGAIDGYALGAPSHAPDVMWVLSLAVRGAARGRGIGRALMRQLLVAMQARGASSIQLTVHPDNRAVALYRELGFEVVTSEPKYFGENEPRLVLELRPAGPPAPEGAP